MEQETNLCRILQSKLSSLTPTSKSGLRTEYEKTKFSKEGKSIEVLLEFDGRNASSGIYWGIKCDKQTPLSGDEAIQIISYLQVNGCQRIALPDDTNSNRQWILWFQLGFNEPIENATHELGLLKQAVEMIGFKEQN